MCNLLSTINLLLVRTDVIFYILSAVFFCAFLFVLMWYLIINKKDTTNKGTKSWTIESAQKFLESNNIEVKESSNKKVTEEAKKIKPAEKSIIIEKQVEIKTVKPKSKANIEEKQTQNEPKTNRPVKKTVVEEKNENKNKTLNRNNKTSNAKVEISKKVINNKKSK